MGCCSIPQKNAFHYSFCKFSGTFWRSPRFTALSGPELQWILIQKAVSDTVFVVFSQKLYVLSGRDNS